MRRRKYSNLMLQVSYNYLFHDLVAVLVRMDSVVCVVFRQSVVIITQKCVEVHIFDLVSDGICVQELIELHYLIGSVGYFRSPWICCGRQYGADDRLDLVCLGNLAHRLDVAEDILNINVSSVFGDVVCSSKDDYVFWSKLNHVFSETYKHLR